VSRLDELIGSYERFVHLPWLPNLAPAQRVWMAVYAPEDERRLRLHLPEFETASKKAGYQWELVDISSSFERWMGSHEYREFYFANPKLIQPDLVGFFDQLAREVLDEMEQKTGPQTIVGLIGCSSLFGLGSPIRVSALIERVESAIEGRLLVFFPGEVDGNNFRLMGAKDGWNYHAVVITAEKG
jgi:hypothetical protein